MVWYWNGTVLNYQDLWSRDLRSWDLKSPKYKMVRLVPVCQVLGHQVLGRQVLGRVTGCKGPKAWGPKVSRILGPWTSDPSDLRAVDLWYHGPQVPRLQVPGYQIPETLSPKDLGARDLWSYGPQVPGSQVLRTQDTWDFRSGDLKSGDLWARDLWPQNRVRHISRLEDPPCAIFLKAWDSRTSNMTFPCEKVSMCEINGAELKKERKKVCKNMRQRKKNGSL